MPSIILISRKKGYVNCLENGMVWQRRASIYSSSSRYIPGSSASFTFFVNSYAVATHLLFPSFRFFY